MRAQHPRRRLCCSRWLRLRRVQSDHRRARACPRRRGRASRAEPAAAPAPGRAGSRRRRERDGSRRRVHRHARGALRCAAAPRSCAPSTAARIPPASPRSRAGSATPATSPTGGCTAWATTRRASSASAIAPDARSPGAWAASTTGSRSRPASTTPARCAHRACCIAGATARPASSALGDTTARLEPVAVATAMLLREVACGGDSCCAIGKGGELLCWGDNREGKIGQDDPYGSPDATAPLVVEPRHALPYRRRRSGPRVRDHATAASSTAGAATPRARSASDARSGPDRAPMRVGDASDWVAVVGQPAPQLRRARRRQPVVLGPQRVPRARRARARRGVRDAAAGGRRARLGRGRRRLVPYLRAQARRPRCSASAARSRASSRSRASTRCRRQPSHACRTASSGSRSATSTPAPSTRPARSIAGAERRRPARPRRPRAPLCPDPRLALSATAAWRRARTGIVRRGGWTDVT